MSRRPQTISIASDERARIPFAVVGVLLLVTSLIIVAQLQTRPEPEHNVDPSLALDRSKSATQAMMKDAVLDATERAGASPVTEPATEGPFANLLGDDDSDPEEVFRNYTALVVYQEVFSRVNGTTQTIRDETTATVTLPEVHDPEEAIDAIGRVHFEKGSSTSDLQTGNLRTTVEEIEFTVERNGNAVATREETITVTVASPLFQVHQKVATYQDRLTMDMTDGGTDYEGVGRKFAARTYPIVIGKSYYNYYRGGPQGAPFQEIVPEKQTELLVNHAIYGVQSNTFGTRDPLWDRPTKSQTVCWLAWETEKNHQTPGNSSILPNPKSFSLPNSSASERTNFNHEDFCNGAEFLFGDSTGSTGDVPSLWDLIGADSKLAKNTDQKMMGKKENVSYEPYAEMGVAEVTDGTLPDDFGRNNVTDDNVSTINENLPSDVDSVTSADVKESTSDLYETLGQVYSLNLSYAQSGTDASFDVSPTRPPMSEPDNRTREKLSSTHEQLDLDVDIETAYQDRAASETNPLLFTISIVEEIERTETYKWEHTDSENYSTVTAAFSDTGTTTAEIKIYGEYAADATLTSDPPVTVPVHSGHVETVFGSGDHTVFDTDSVTKNAFRILINERATAEQAETKIENSLDDGTHLETWDFVHQSPITPNNLLHNRRGELSWGQVTSPDSREALFAEIQAALRDGKERTIDLGPRHYNRTEYITGSPIEEFHQHYLNHSTAVVYGETDEDAFDTMAEFLGAEVRAKYYGATDSYIADAEDGHQSALKKLTDKISGGLDTLNEALDLAQKAVNRDPPTYGGSMETTELLGNVSFEVRGSPTYLEFDDLEREDVPAVRPRGNAARDLSGADEIDYVPASSQYTNRFGYFGLPIAPPITGWFVTASSWNVDVHGEYARFEVTANVSDPSRSTALTYVREDKNVTVTVGEKTAIIGDVEPIEIDTGAEFPVVVPAGKAGAGDPKHTGKADIDVDTDEWAYAGPGYEKEDDPWWLDVFRTGPVQRYYFEGLLDSLRTESRG